MIAALDLAWERINALGGYVGPDDPIGQAGRVVIDGALKIIEELGGSDPLPKRTMLAALREIEEIADGEADVDDGIPNTAMRILVIVRAAIAKAGAAHA